MYINKNEKEEKTSLRDQFGKEIRNIAKKRLNKENLSAVSREILEEIVLDKPCNKSQRT
jgi:hypothetical protein